MNKNANARLDFIIVGAQKCGTTALWTFLKDHKEIELSENKELHFFDNEDLNWEIPDYSKLHSHFKHLDTNIKCGESTPIYAYWKQSIERIWRYNSKTKIILQLRDPAARAYSQWRMATARKFETYDFSNVIREGRYRIRDKLVPTDRSRRFNYVERGLYANQLKRIFHYFSPDQIHILTHYDLKYKHEETLDKICDFLQVSKFSSYPKQQIVFSHSSVENNMPNKEDIRYLRKLFQDDLINTEALIGRSIELEF